MSVLMVSSKVRYAQSLQKYIQPNVMFLQYKYDSGFDGIYDMLKKALNNEKLKNLALVLYSTPFSVYICSHDSKVQCLNLEGVASNSTFFHFLNKLNSLYSSSDNCRLDLLSCNVSSANELQDITIEINKHLTVPCFISKDLWGSDLFIDEFRSVTDVYFSATNLSLVSTNQTISSFERIRTVGKGAFGTAVLYRKKDDESLVILKEINMHDLTASERQLAINEVKVLSLLDHPNIVAYYDSFEEDGALLIEMEYAENGTLQQFLAAQIQPLSEQKILELFHQIVLAIHYIHEHKILHRDLKTANIFLTTEDIIKVGDFGISKMLSTTLNGAQSVIGTPYYISPEMCQGKLYNEKSDVWSLGCILYEMVCLHKTFEGTNLPALVNKILKGQFEPVKGNYSDELKELIDLMLQKNPSDRLSTEVILYQKLPMMILKFQIKRPENDSNKRQTRSILYQMDLKNLKLKPIHLPTKIRIKQVCSGENHIVVLTTDRTVYSWGVNEFGQLGHGDVQYRARPQLLSCLNQKSLTRIACGNNYSVFVSENGIIMTCGNGNSGCLGHGDLRDVYKPKLIESLLSVDIASVSATHCHVVVVSSDGHIYAWGSNKHGELGMDACNVIYNTPQQISIREPVHVVSAYTSQDATVLVTNAGAVLASGSNYENKLGLNARQGFLMTMKSISQQPIVPGVHQFTNVRGLTHHKINQVALGAQHTLFLCESGKLLVFGNYRFNGNPNNLNNLTGNNYEVRGLKRKNITKVICGSTFSVVRINYDSLYFWGKRQVEEDEAEEEDADYHNNDEMEIRNASLITTSKSQTTSPPNSDKEELSKSTNRNRDPIYYHDNGHHELDNDYKIYNYPRQILRLENPMSVQPDHELITLSDCIVHQDQQLLIQVETTAPPPEKKRHKRSKTVSAISSWNSNEFVTGNSFSATHLAELSPSNHNVDVSNHSNISLDNSTNSSIPTWVQNELLDATIIPKNILGISVTPPTNADSVKDSPSISHLTKTGSNSQFRIYSSCGSKHDTQMKLKSHGSETVKTEPISNVDNMSSSTVVDSTKAQIEKEMYHLKSTISAQQQLIQKRDKIIQQLEREIQDLKCQNAPKSYDNISTACNMI